MCKGKCLQTLMDACHALLFGNVNILLYLKSTQFFSRSGLILRFSIQFLTFPLNEVFHFLNYCDVARKSSSIYKFRMMLLFYLLTVLFILANGCSGCGMIQWLMWQPLPDMARLFYFCDVCLTMA